MSRPVRARGLKRLQHDPSHNIFDVAPRAGAWIETYTVASRSFALWSRPVRARGLKLCLHH